MTSSQLKQYAPRIVAFVFVSGLIIFFLFRLVTDYSTGTRASTEVATVTTSASDQEVQVGDTFTVTTRIDITGGTDKYIAGTDTTFSYNQDYVSYESYEIVNDYLEEELLNNEENNTVRLMLGTAKQDNLESSATIVYTFKATAEGTANFAIAQDRSEAIGGQGDSTQPIILSMPDTDLTASVEITSATTTCSTIDDCPADQTCDRNNGVCVEPPDDPTNPGNPGTPCSYNSDCEDDEICNTSTFVCEPEPEINPGGLCEDDADCAAGQECDDSGSLNVCVDGPYPACTSDASCQNGEFCNTETNTCEEEGPATCDTNSDCADSEICNAETRTCEPGTEGGKCESDADCDGGEVCDNQRSNATDTCVDPIDLTPTAEPTNDPNPTDVTRDCSLQPEGDANCDSVIDATDYVIWRNAYTDEGVPSNTDPDFNADGEVNLVDLQIWVTGDFNH